MIETIAVDLYRTGVFKLGSFRLKSGDISPFYLDLRLIPSVPSLFKKVRNIYVSLIRDLGYTPSAVAGIMSAGIPFATAVCLEMSVPLLQIRSEKKTHGTKKMIEGIYPPSGQVVLLDDLISTGASKIHPLTTLREEGMSCRDLVVLIDRTSGDEVRQLLAENDLQLHSAGNLGDLFRSLVNSDEIPAEEVTAIEQAFETWLGNT